jgi:AsmA family/AsmA-like C-terminal region
MARLKPRFDRVYLPTHGAFKSPAREVPVNFLLSAPGTNRVKKLSLIGAAIAVFLIAGLLVAPHFIDLGTFKQAYLPLIEDTFQRRIDVDEVRLSLVPTPSIRLSNLKVLNGSALPDDTFFEAQQMLLRLRFWPLLRGKFEVTELILEKPVINLLRKADGTFNYSDPAGGKGALAKNRANKKTRVVSKPQESAAMPLIVPARMRIRDGRLNIQTMGRQPVHINGIDLSLQEFSSDHPFPYRASFSYPGLKTIALEGTLTYQENESILRLQDNRLKLHDLVLPLEGSISSLSTVPRLDLSVAGDPIDAKPVFQILAALGLAPNDTEVSGPMGLRVKLIGPSHSLAAQVYGQFKDVKVHGRDALKGNLSGEIFIKLSLGGGSSIARRLQGNGNLLARDGELTNVNLLGKVQRVAGLLGLSRNERRQATTFKTLRADFILAEGLADFKRLYLVNPQMEVNGNGTMTLERPWLDIALEAALSAQASVRAGKGRTATFFKDSRGRIVVPLTVTGPVQNPSMDLDSAKVLRRGSDQRIEKGLGSFFKQLFRNK